jgi:predicted dehydrogenase
MGARSTLLGARRAGRQWMDPVEKPIRVGVAGLGPRSRHNAIRSFMKFDEFELISICDVRPELVELVNEDLKNEHCTEVNSYTDYTEMLKSERLDAVCIQVDVDRQIELACQAMDAGLDVMVEVPLTYSIEDCWKVVTTVERTGRTFFMMEQVRYAGYVEAYREVVQSGVLGKPVFAEGEYFHFLPGYFFQGDDGKWFSNDDFGKDPAAKTTWRYTNPAIGYLPHDLSPLLYILDDRITRVVGMANQKQSYKYPNMEYCDTQAALMHTENDVVMRLAAGFSTVNSNEYCHWQHIKCTDGEIEGPRASGEKHKLFVPKWQMKHPVEMDWGFLRIDAPPAASESGHGGMDYFAFATFADSILHDVPLLFDVYRAVETAAPAILAAQSIENENIPIDVPDFRPGPHRNSGEMPDSK